MRARRLPPLEWTGGPDRLSAIPGVAPNSDTLFSLLTTGLDVPEGQVATAWKGSRRRLRRKQRLYRAGDAWHALFVVRAGSLAVWGSDEHGGDQIMEFPLPGDVLGADGLSSGRYHTDVVALEPTEVDMWTPDRLDHLTLSQGLSGSILTRLLARAIAQQRQALLIHAAQGAFGRVARFLLLHDERFSRAPSVRPDLVLSITREQLGNHIGLRLETVSRALSAFHRAGLATVRGRSVRIDDRERLIDVARTGFISHPGPNETPRRGEFDAEVTAHTGCGSHSQVAATSARCDGTRVRMPTRPLGDAQSIP